MNMVQVLTQVEDAKMQVQAVSFPNRVAITYRSHSMGSSTLHLEACDPGARHKSPAVQISQKLSAAKEFRLRSFTWERQLMALSPTIISAQGSGCPASIWGWCPAISNLKWILGSLGIFWENSRFVTHIFQNRLQPPRPFSRFFFTISPMSSLTNFRYGVFVNIGCAKDARLNVSRQMAKARWKGLYGRLKEKHLTKKHRFDDRDCCHNYCGPPHQSEIPQLSIRGLSVAQMPKNHTIPASRILPSPFPPGPKSWKPTRNSLKRQEFRKGDEIYGMTIETVVPWTSSKKSGTLVPLCDERIS